MPKAPLAVLVACSFFAPPVLALGEDPVALMTQLESRLAAARRVLIEADIESTGAIAVRLKGSTEVDDRNRARLAYAGEFAGKPVNLSLAADGRTLKVANGSAQQALPVEPESNRALLIGFARMGALHNLARAVSLQGPDHGGAGVTQWVQMEAFRPTTYAIGGELEGLMSFGYDLVVDGQTSGSVRLWLDPETQLPKRRSVLVHFPQGDMTVTESYTAFRLE